MLDQLALLTNILENKEVSGTYKGIAFKGVVTEVYPVYHRGNAPISFTLKLASDCQQDGLPLEEKNTAVFYSSDTQTRNGSILELKKVAWSKSKKR